MIISRTPFRISFFGGGTDYPIWFREHGGAVLGTTINKYCYISVRYLPPFFEHRIRIVYSYIESCQRREEIRHPSVREVLRHLDIDRGMEIHHDGDLPARGGIGSSSAFTVGLLNALHALEGHMVHKRQLASESIHIEQNVLKETVGCQDQVLAAHGGLNHISFHPTDDITVQPLTLTRDRIDELNSHLMLFFTGIVRTASGVANTYVPRLSEKAAQLHKMSEMVDEGVSILHQKRDLGEFGRLLHEAWKLKRELSNGISNPEVEQMYEEAMRGGALGGKLTGAGGGGFLLMFAPPEAHDEIRQRLHNLIYVPLRIEFSGSQIIFFDPEEDYANIERNRIHEPTSGFRELKPLWETAEAAARPAP